MGGSADLVNDEPMKIMSEFIAESKFFGNLSSISLLSDSKNNMPPRASERADSQIIEKILVTLLISDDDLV